jgi:Tfp pilus assembly protein PilF
MNRILTYVCITLCATLISGCASMGTGGAAPSSAAGDDASINLYDGEPEVVFATEFPVASAEEAVARADHALREGDMDLALYMYVRAYDLDKDNVHALARIGEIHESRGNDRLATMAFSGVLRIDPDYARALQSLGLIYLQSKNHGEAQALLERAIAEDPSLWRAQNGVGILADMRGDHAKAIEAYDAALAANPGAGALLNNRGYSLYLDGQYEAASRDFLEAAAQGTERAWLNLGLVQARQKRYAEAVQTMARNVAIEVAYNDVGFIAMRQGDLAVAEHYFHKAIGHSPRYFEEAQRNLMELEDRSISGEPLAYTDETKD